MVVSEMTGEIPLTARQGGFFPSMDIQYDKPFRDYNSMVELLQNRGLTVQDRTYAIQALGNYSYYSLINKSKNSLLTIPGTDSYIPGDFMDRLSRIV